MSNYIKNKVNIFYRRLRIFSPYQYLSAAFFLVFNYHHKSRKKIFYCLVPPPELQNIGDHAQAIIIRTWLKHNFNDYKILELDKNKSRSSGWIWGIRKILAPNDLFFIHSGGNLSDRALWSENGRRKIISSFHQNSIYILPQTIYFSETKKGKHELDKSKKIYNNHPNLIVTGRDLQSKDLATEYFKNAQVFSCPDFVLLFSEYFKEIQYNNPGKDVLFCFRNDKESALDIKDRKAFLNSYSNLQIEEFDTTINNYIYKNQEKQLLQKTIKYFSNFRVIVTDRYHGLIFSIMAKRPCIILPTVDHKLTAAYNSWFKDINGVFLSLNINHTKELLDEILKKNVEIAGINWNKKYFREYTEKIKSNVAKIEKEN